MEKLNDSGNFAEEFCPTLIPSPEFEHHALRKGLSALYFCPVAGVVEWQTRRIQNPLGVIARAGSSPASGNFRNAFE